MLIGILSDAHGNCPALKLGLDILDGLGCESIYFLGDSVGYLVGVDALRTLTERPITCIRGNHEQILLDSPNKHNPAYRIEETRQLMTETLWEHVRKWAVVERLDVSAGSILFVHGSPEDPLNGRVYPDTDLSQFKLEDGMFVFMGHTHRPMIRHHSGVRYVNVGSVGLPRDDGRLGSVCTLDCDTGKIRILRFAIDGLPTPTDLGPWVSEARARRSSEPIGELIVF